MIVVPNLGLKRCFFMRMNLRERLRKAVSALSGPFPPLKGNVVASAANSRSLKHIFLLFLIVFAFINLAIILLYVVIRLMRH